MTPDLAISLSECVKELYEVRQQKKQLAAREKELTALIVERDTAGWEQVVGSHEYTIVTTADRIHVNYDAFSKAVLAGVIDTDLWDQLTAYEVDKDAFMAAVDAGRISDEGVRACCKVTKGSSSVRVKESK